MSNERLNNLLSDYDASIDQAIAESDAIASADYITDMVADCLERIRDSVESLKSGEWVRRELRGFSPAEVRIYWIEQYCKPGVIFDSLESIEAFRQRIADRFS